jgi:hypothetical protein
VGRTRQCVFAGNVIAGNDTLNSGHGHGAFTAATGQDRHSTLAAPA